MPKQNKPDAPVLGANNAARVQEPIFGRAATISPQTFDPETRTVTLVWTTGAQVRRYDWYRKRAYIEELEVSDSAIRMDRLNAGAPILDTHESYSLANVIGRVERAWIENGVGMAEVRFSDRDEVAGIVRDIASGIICNVSVGYARHRKEIIERDGEDDLYRIVDWEPMEISMVPIPADAGAQTRAEQGRTFVCDTIRKTRAPAPVETKQESPMDPETIEEGAGTETRANIRTDAAASAPAETGRTPDQADVTRAAETARAEERQRISDIRDAVRDFGFGEAAADDFIRGDQSIHDVRAALQKRLAERSRAETPGRQHVRVEAGGLDERETRVAAMSEAIAHRCDPSQALPERAREYRGLSLIEMARAALEAEGVRTGGMSRREIADAALGRGGGSGLAVRAGMHTVSDFPIVLGNQVNRTLRAAYEVAPRTFAPIARRTSVSDFRPVIRAQIGDAPRMLKLNEHGEYQSGTIGEASESYSLDTWGRKVAITRQTLINDDLDAFTRLPNQWGVAAAAVESDVVWGIISANAALSDGVALFHADHGNLAGTGTALSVASVGAAKAAMRKQRSLAPGGKRGEQGYLLGIEPRVLAVPSDLETTAAQFLSATVVPTKDSDINPWKASLELIVEPRLDAITNAGKAWFLFANPGAVDTIEYAYLDGEEGVYTETRQGFDVDGIEIKARLDFGAAAIDYRGMYKNAGPAG